MCVTAPFICHPEVNVSCHAGNRSVKVQTLYLSGQNAPEKTTAINQKQNGIFPTLSPGGYRLLIYSEI